MGYILMESASWVPKDMVGPGCTLQFALYDRHWSKSYDLPNYSLDKAKKLLELPEFRSEFPEDALDEAEVSSSILVRECLIVEVNEDGSFINGDALKSAVAISKLSIGLKEINRDTNTEILFPERFSTVDAAGTFKRALENRNQEMKYAIVYNAPPTDIKPRIRIKAQI